MYIHNISHLTHKSDVFSGNISDTKVHGANMGTTWGRQDPGGPHVGPMNFAIWDVLGESKVKTSWRHPLIWQIQIVAQCLWIFHVMDECSKFQCRSSLPKQCPTEASLPPPNGEGYVFNFIGLWVCLFLFCLSFNNIAGKPMDKFSWNLQDMLGKIQWTIWIFFFFFFLGGGGGGRGVCLPLAYRVLFYMFSRKSVSVINITEKRMDGFSWNFSGKVGHETMNTLEHF